MTDDAPEFPPLQPCEVLADNPTEWFFRQVHPTFESEGMIDVEAFTDSAHRQLSGARSSKQTARGAYEEWVARPGRLSAGTWGVTVAQVQRAGGRIIDDSACPLPEGVERWPTGHAYLDQRLNGKQARAKLRDAIAGAAARNRRKHPPLVLEGLNPPGPTWPGIQLGPG